MRRRPLLFIVAALTVASAGACQSATPEPPPTSVAPPSTSVTSTTAAPATVGLSPRFTISAGSLTNLWVDPRNGSDSANGTTRANALRTLDAAWRRIPTSSTLTRGFRIQLVAGDHPEETLPNYLEHRWGTARAPIIFNSVDGPGRARLLGDLNVFDTRHLYLVGITIDAPGDAFHCERCDHLLVRQVTMDSNGGWETVKVNQSSNVFIEDSELSGAGDNVVDFVAVHTGHMVGNVIHDAGDWCAYVKGGSSRIVIDANEIFDCGNGGFTAGQGTGFEFMTAPWLRYEAYDVLVTNNVIHHTAGAAFGVNGATNTLFAHNTAYRVGARSHAVEVFLGGRSCDGDSAGCSANRSLGGWGGAGLDGQWIPNNNVGVINNVVVNPSEVASPWGQVSVQGDADAPSASGVPASGRADTGLRVKGNVFANGTNAIPVIDGVGCNRTGCNATLLERANRFAAPAGLLVSPDQGDWQLTSAFVGGGTPVAFRWVEREPGTGIWAPPATWTQTRSGATRSSTRPGAL